jgi:hypothetical protein
MRAGSVLTHRIVRWGVAVSAGLALALYSYERISDPEPRLQRAREEAVVLASRDILRSYVSPTAVIEVVDPLAPNRKVGKVFIYPASTGWEVSGYYRRDAKDPWHPYLINLDSGTALVSLAVRDGSDRLIGMSAQDPKFSAVP